MLDKKRYIPPQFTIEDKSVDKGGNTGLPFGLCAKYGIKLPDGATPRDAWQALKEKTGKSPDDFYKELDGKDKDKNRISYEPETKDADIKGEDFFAEPETPKVNTDKIKPVLGEQHASEIGNVLSKNQELAKIYNKYAENLKISDANDGSGDFQYSTLGIRFNIGKDSAPVSEFKGHPYSTYFHETGHNIDYLASGKPYSFFTQSFRSEKYKREIEYFQNGKSQTLERGYSLSAMIQEEAKEYIVSLKKRRGVKRQAEVYSEIANDLKTVAYADSGAASDMFRGVSNGGIVGNAGHAPSYFKKDASMYGVEFFAECFSAELVSPKGVEITKKYFPKSFEIYQEIKNKLLNK